MRIRNLQCRGWKWTHKSLKKWWDFDKKCSFWNLFFEMKITCMPIACFVIWLFTVNDFFSVISLWRTYACSHPNSGSKRTHYGWKMYFWSLISKMNVTCMLIVCFIFSSLALDTFFFVFYSAYACTSPS